MRVVLVAPPTPNPSPTYFGPPMGLALLGALLEARGHSVRGYDWDRSTLEAMLDDLPRLLAEDRPELFGISCLSITRGQSFALARRVRELAPSVPIIFGGPYPSIEPVEILERTPADFVCIGDGEETLPELCDALGEGRDPKSVPGLCLRAASGTERTAPRPDFTELDRLPYPNLDLFDVRGELEKRRRNDAAERDQGLSSKGRPPYLARTALMVLGSRGCVWRCDFCPMSKFKGRTRMHSPAYVADYIEYLVNRYDQREFVFGDNTLTWHRPHAVQLFERLAAKRLDISWICMTRADRVDPELLRLMRAAGCREISYGIESGSPEVQQAMRKKLKLGSVVRAFHDTHDAGINSTCMLMIGNRGETRESVRATSGLVRDADPDRILIWTTRLYPGTVLHDVAVAEGVISRDYYADEMAPAPFYTGENSSAELSKLETLLQHRTIWVDASPEVPLADVDRDLRLSAWRAEAGVVLGGPGGEPLSRPDFDSVLEAGKRWAKRVLLVTSAEPLAQRATVSRVQRANVVRGIVVPLWSMSDAHHDSRVGRSGALLDTRKGILRWTRDDASALGLAMLDKFNVSTLPAWVRWLRDHRMREAVFVYGRSAALWQAMPEADLPSLAETHDSLLRARETAREVGLELWASGLPRCMVPEGVELFEAARPFDERVRPGGEPENLSIARRREHKRFHDSCEGCTLAGECEGVWHAAPDAPAALRPGRDAAEPARLPLVQKAQPSESALRAR